jgi:hypothetical protein
MTFLLNETFITYLYTESKGSNFIFVANIQCWRFRNKFLQNAQNSCANEAPKYIEAGSLFCVYFVPFIKIWPGMYSCNRLKLYKNISRSWNSTVDPHMSLNGTVSVNIIGCCCCCLRQLTKLLERRFKMDGAPNVNRSFLLPLMPLRPGTCHSNINRGLLGNLEPSCFSI